MKVYVEFRKKINEKYGRRVREYMNSSRNKKDLKKREKIQLHFWNQVGCDEHISLPMLENEIIKEFKCKDDRFVRVQVNLMQFETRIRIESRVKVWIKEPINSY
ncbi:MAG TPA: hypothetical protein VK209_12660 [Candidatus Sulfotelmatobacter sp.]|nr:hypothetical protein [Candidatus Sulfotelmatobacter sp.]